MVCQNRGSQSHFCRIQEGLHAAWPFELNSIPAPDPFLVKSAFFLSTHTSTSTRISSNCVIICLCTLSQLTLVSLVSLPQLDDFVHRTFYGAKVATFQRVSARFPPSVVLAHLNILLVATASRTSFKPSYAGTQSRHSRKKQGLPARQLRY